MLQFRSHDKDFIVPLNSFSRKSFLGMVHERKLSPILGEWPIESIRRIVAHLNDKRCRLNTKKDAELVDYLGINPKFSYETILCDEFRRVEPYDPLIATVYGESLVTEHLTCIDEKYYRHLFRWWPSSWPDVLQLDVQLSKTSLPEVLNTISIWLPKIEHICIVGLSILQAMRGIKPVYTNIYFIRCEKWQARRSLLDIFNHLSQLRYTKVTRQQGLITFSSTDFTWRVHLKIYHSITQLLWSQTVDSNGLAYWNGELWISDRADHALTQGYNVSDILNRELTLQLIETSAAGIGIRIPNVDRDKFAPTKKFNVHALYDSLALLTELDAEEILRVWWIEVKDRQNISYRTFMPTLLLHNLKTDCEDTFLGCCKKILSKASEIEWKLCDLLAYANIEQTVVAPVLNRYIELPIYYDERVAHWDELEAHEGEKPITGIFNLAPEKRFWVSLVNKNSSLTAKRMKRKCLLEQCQITIVADEILAVSVKYGWEMERTSFDCLMDIDNEIYALIDSKYKWKVSREVDWL